jgi:excisionase family DNA binding protein
VVGQGDEGDVLTPPEAAKLLRIGKNTLYEMTARGRIPHRRAGRLIRFSRRALLDWLACQQVADRS